jgi:hypothetical protein
MEVINMSILDTMTQAEAREYLVTKIGDILDLNNPPSDKVALVEILMKKALGLKEED